MIDILSALPNKNNIKGLTTLVIILNNFGKLFFASFAESYIASESFKSMKKLVLKDPNPKKDCFIEI